MSGPTVDELEDGLADLVARVIVQVALGSNPQDDLTIPLTISAMPEMEVRRTLQIAVKLLASFTVAMRQRDAESN